MRLYGSTTSPYVRRIRVFMHAVGKQTDYEFVNLQIFTEQDRATLTALNPTLKIPMLEDNGQVIFDSRVIYRYLAQKMGIQALSWQDENYLTMIDAANDSLVQMFLLKRSGVDTSEDKLFFNLQEERIQTVIRQLDRLAADGVFEQWQYPSLCLYCMLDWIDFRQLMDLGPFQHLNDFVDKNRQREEVAATIPHE